MKAAVQEFELVIRRATWEANSAGMTPYPSLQPVMAYVFECPFKMIVRSAGDMPGNEATLANSPSYTMLSYISSESTGMSLATAISAIAFKSSWLSTPPVGF